MALTPFFKHITTQILSQEKIFSVFAKEVIVFAKIIDYNECKKSLM